MNESDSSPIAWQELVAPLVRHSKLILAVFAGGTLTAAMLTFLQAPSYKASAKLMVTSERARITVSPDPRSGATVDNVTELDFNSEVALLGSPTLLREVLEPYRHVGQEPEGSAGQFQRVVALLRWPLRLPSLLYKSIYGVPPTSSFEYWVQSVAGRLAITTIRGSNLIAVSYEDSSPVWVAEFVNKLVTHHIERQARLNQQSAALRFLEGQRELLSDRLRDAEAALSSFYGREGLDALPDQRAALRARVATLELDLGSANTELAEATARAEFLTKAIASVPKTVPGDVRLGQSPAGVIGSRIMELELQRSQLLSQFVPTSMRVQEVERQLVEAQRLLAAEEKKQGGSLGIMNPTHQSLELDLAQTQAQSTAVAARMEALREQTADSRRKLNHLDEVASEQERLDQNVTSAKEAFLTYLKKVEEARFSNALDESRIVNVSIVETAEVPTVPQPTKRSLTILMGMILSLCVGLGLAFARDRLDPAVKSAAEAKRISGLTILAEIPR